MLYVTDISYRSQEFIMTDRPTRMTKSQAVAYFLTLASDESGDDDDMDLDGVEMVPESDESGDESDDQAIDNNDKEPQPDMEAHGSTSRVDTSADGDVEMFESAIQRQEIVRSKDGREWKIIGLEQCTPAGRVEQHNVFKVRSGPTHVCRGIETCEDAWNLIVDEGLLRNIRDCTIDYARNVETAKKPLSPIWDVSIPELKAFVGLLYLRGVIHMTNFEENRLWSKLPGLESFSQTMPRDRFRDIKKMLRFDRKLTRSSRLAETKFAAMGEIIDRFQANSQRAYTPEFSLTVDEQLFPCKSRCKYTQYMPNKPDKFGIKFWLLAELASKYCLAIIPYGGADETRIDSLGTHVVWNLMTPYLKKGYNVCTDNFFTNINLAEKLARNGTSIVGTLRANKREVPRGKPKLELHESEFFETGVGTGAVANLVRYQTKKKKSVLLLSTMHRGSVRQPDKKLKPATILFYNSNKCGVDMLDSMARMHSTKSPMRRWPMAVFCNILDLAAINAWIIFRKETGKQISRWDFLHGLALSLIEPEIGRRHGTFAEPGPQPSRKRRTCAIRSGCKENKTRECCTKCHKAMCGRCQALICTNCAE
jgi:hypothetical protein